MRVREPHPLRSQFVDVRSWYLAPYRVVTLHVSIAEVVGINDEDVGLDRLRKIFSLKFGQESYQQGCQECDEFHLNPDR